MLQFLNGCFECCTLIKVGGKSQSGPRSENLLCLSSLWQPAFVAITPLRACISLRLHTLLSLLAQTPTPRNTALQYARSHRLLPFEWLWSDFVGVEGRFVAKFLYSLLHSLYSTTLIITVLLKLILGDRQLVLDGAISDIEMLLVARLLLKRRRLILDNLLIIKSLRAGLNRGVLILYQMLTNINVRLVRLVINHRVFRRQ